MRNEIDLRQVKFRENSFTARIAAAKLGSTKIAMVLGNTIHLYGVTRADFLKDTAWVNHEYCHIAQFRRYGFVRFLGLYFLEYCRHGYHQNKYEIEAREAENNI